MKERYWKLFFFYLFKMKLIRFFLCFCGIALAMFFIFWISSLELTDIEGWDLKRSTNVEDPISEMLKPHIIPEDFCIKQEDLLVMVQSRPSNFESRSAIRATWGQKRNNFLHVFVNFVNDVDIWHRYTKPTFLHFAGDNVSFFFLLGEIKDNPSIQSEVELESLIFGDIIQERFIDHYNNLTLKSVSMLKLFSLYCAKTYKYLMKIDDDVFLNTRLVMRMLSKRTSSKDLLVGYVLNNTKPFRNKSHKWYVPYELYPDEKYPDYLCGCTYLMSSDVAQKLYRCVLKTSIFRFEDVYVTGICAKKANVTPKHDSHFTCNILDNDFCLHRHLYSVHFYTLETPKSIRSSYQLLENNECASRKQ